jgi:hypothetical protein
MPPVAAGLPLASLRLTASLLAPVLGYSRAGIQAGIPLLGFLLPALALSPAGYRFQASAPAPARWEMPAGQLAQLWVQQLLRAPALAGLSPAAP